MDYARALGLGRDSAGGVRSAELDRDARQLQARALDGLGGPTVSATGFYGRVRTAINLDLTQVAQAVNPLVGVVDQVAPALNVQPVPSTFTTYRTVTMASYGLSTVWPMYTGGRFTALQRLADARAQEAVADVQEAQDRSASLTAQRYFSVQLARQALQVRSAALSGITEHRRMALRLEAAGLIAQVERLKADVALDSARRDEARARNDLALARVALARHLGAGRDQPDAQAQWSPTTPLFVHREPVDTLEAFIAAGMVHHPAWVRLAAKRAQADQALALEDHAHTPTLLGLGNYNANRSHDALVQPTWAVGVMLNIPLIDAVDRRRLADAARLQQRRVEENALQAGRDIPTLIEAQWRAMDNARLQFLSMDSSVALARESLRLQEVAFRQSQATSVDVTDASLALAKVETERVQAAYDYVMALARLLEACGEPERLPQLAAAADLTLTLPPP
ncbi:MAG TPA: TolC family protein [Burkholderiaceae bacterium]|nr:TolC family protein [Burkholderiaceae bacterium]HMY98069.1 TolC family protein [Burkholderiaceae bacterium]HNB43107.1 TolC family protein [Burkholderiaceae bacterium]